MQAKNHMEKEGAGAILLPVLFLDGIAHDKKGV
jgi:hypothetical protein